MADKYVIRVTAGSSRDVESHTVVPVNSAEPVEIDTPHMAIALNIRVQDYSGLPRGSPSSSPYFDAEPHRTAGDRYSIALRFTPKPPPAGGRAGGGGGGGGGDKGIAAPDLQWGNDFDHPVRSRLPPGFGTAMNIVKWWIDPGLDGDVYADQPYLYGPALSSFNAVHVGAGEHDPEKGGLWFDEGGDEEGLGRRRELGCPDDSSGRKKWALRAEGKEKWLWEYGQTYGVDFYNAFLDFSEFSLRLPGFHLPIMKYWDGQGLRYVLRNRATEQLYVAIVFSLYLKEDVNEDGSLKPSALEVKVGRPEEDHAADNDHVFDEKAALEEARKTLSQEHLETSGAGAPETSPDDVD